MPHSDFPFRFSGALWSSLTSDPGTAVLISDSRGRAVWVDEGALSMFFEPGLTVPAVIGRQWVGGQDAGWLSEWLVLLKQVAEDGRARVLRCIWRGYQTFFWVHAAEASESGANGDGVVNGEAGVALNGHSGRSEGNGTVSADALAGLRYLVIARRITQDLVDGPGRLNGSATGGPEVIESGYADLGPLSVLSSRELEVLALLGQGMTAKEIAGVLHRSPKTVENHRNAIGNKLGVGDRVLLAAMARRAGLTRADAGKKRIRLAV
ncbi:MAG: LuxR C-terminal-related transcriptional regulator [Planctomycetota bacterium]